MSDATLIAGELAGIADGMERLAAALAEMRPVVNVPQATPVVNVPPAEVVVNVPQAVPQVTVGAPVVNVPATPPRSYVVRVTERDLDGLISAFTITPA